MPYWWTTAHWQDQYAQEVTYLSDISLNMVKTSTQADDRLRYCPAWITAKKKGRPKADVREKSVMDIIEESAKKKKQSRRNNLFCNICFKHNHNTADCFQNPANKQKASAKRMSEEEYPFDDDYDDDDHEGNEDGLEGKA